MAHQNGLPRMSQIYIQADIHANANSSAMFGRTIGLAIPCDPKVWTYGYTRQQLEAELDFRIEAMGQ